MSTINPSSVTQTDVDDTDSAIALLTESNQFLSADPANVDDLLDEEPDILEEIGEVESTVEETKTEGKGENSGCAKASGNAYRLVGLCKIYTYYFCKAHYARYAKLKIQEITRSLCMI